MLVVYCLSSFFMRIAFTASLLELGSREESLALLVHVKFESGESFRYSTDEIKYSKTTL